MKKIFAFYCLLCVFLAGCGAKPAAYASLPPMEPAQREYPDTVAQEENPELSIYDAVLKGFDSHEALCQGVLDAQKSCRSKK